MASNGKLKDSELADIPGGRLRKDAAAAWNAPGGPGDAGLRPTGSKSSYRLYADQQYFWEHQPPLAAYPGTSNHGWGLAVDLAEPWMRDWIDAHGAKYGWAKTEAFSEWWHVTFVGGVSFPSFQSLKHGDKGKRVLRFSRRLRFIHRPKGPSFLKRIYWKFKDGMVDGVKDFQRDQGLKPDGVIGPRTAARINSTFKRQRQNRKKR